MYNIINIIFEFMVDYHKFVMKLNHEHIRIIFIQFFNCLRTYVSIYISAFITLFFCKMLKMSFVKALKSQCTFAFVFNNKVIVEIKMRHFDKWSAKIKTF